MKFLSAQPFEKHFNEAYKDHLSSFYGIFMKEPFERRFLMERLAEKMEGKKKWIHYSDTSVDTLFEEINSRDLFHSKKIIFYDGVEWFRQEDHKWMKRLKHLPEDLFLILGGANFSNYDEIKKEIILLDLSFEKPWDRIARLNRWLLEEVQKKGKSLTKEALGALSTLPHYDFALLLQEIEKWVTYVGKENVIDKSAIQEVGSLDFSQKGWQLSDAIVWEGKMDVASLNHLDVAKIQKLFPQLRYHLQLGLIICLSLGRNKENLIKKEYPKLSHQAVLRYKKLASTLKMTYFQRGLKELFQIELDFRSKSLHSKTCIERLFAFLQKERSCA